MRPRRQVGPVRPRRRDRLPGRKTGLTLRPSRPGAAWSAARSSAPASRPNRLSFFHPLMHRCGIVPGRLPRPRFPASDRPGMKLRPGPLRPGSAWRRRKPCPARTDGAADSGTAPGPARRDRDGAQARGSRHAPGGRPGCPPGPRAAQPAIGGESPGLAGRPGTDPGRPPGCHVQAGPRRDRAAGEPRHQGE